MSANHLDYKLSDRITQSSDPFSFESTHHVPTKPRKSRRASDGASDLPTSAHSKQKGVSKGRKSPDCCDSQRPTEFLDDLNLANVYHSFTPHRQSLVPTIMITSPSQPNEFGFRIGTAMSLDLHNRSFGKHVRPRGSLPLNIPEPIPEVVLPRRHSVSFQSSMGTQPTDLDLMEDSELYRPHSPLRASDLVVPCSDAFEQVLKDLEIDHYQQQE